MNKEKLMPLLKYYHGESKPPEDYNKVQQLWWEGEKLLIEKVERDASFFKRVLSQYREALDANGVSAVLADKKVDEDKRAKQRIQNIITIARLARYVHTKIGVLK